MLLYVVITTKVNDSFPKQVLYIFRHLILFMRSIIILSLHILS